MFFLEARDSEAEAAARRALEIDGIDGTNPADRYLLSKSTVVADEHSPRLAPPLPIMPTALGATPLRGQNHNAGGKLPPLLPYSRTSAIIHRSSWQNFICSSTLVSASSRSASAAFLKSTDIRTFSTSVSTQTAKKYF
jgi:hypothetical protein